MLGEILWSFRPGSFLPHRVEADSAEGNEPVTVSCRPVADLDADVLINISDQACPDPGRFSRANELILNEQDSLQEGRARYKQYQDLGITPNTIKP